MQRVAAGTGPEQDNAGDNARQAARHPWTRVAFRFGIAARGVVYLLVAWLAAEVALGAGAPDRGAPHAPADTRGALEALAGTAPGRVALVVLAVGAAAYAVLMLADGTLAHREERSPMPKWGNRALSLFGMVLYAMLAAQALHVLVGARPRGNRQQRAFTAQLLHLPYGRALVIAVAVGLVAVAVGLVRRALLRTYLQQLRVEAMSPRSYRVAAVLGGVGTLARAAVAVLVAVFVTQAGVTSDAAKSRGLDQSLRALARGPYGPWALGAVAAGLAVFGAYCLLEARWRDL